MSNDLTNLVKVHYQESIQENLEKNLTAMDLAGMIDIPNGTTKNLPYIKPSAVGEYVKYSSNTAQDVLTGNDQIVINKTPYILFALDRIDMDEDYIKAEPELISDASYQIKRQIDGEFFAQVANAKWKYDANGFGLNSGTLSPVTLTTGASQNISTVFGKAKAGLTHSGANSGKLVLTIDEFISADLTTLGMETNVQGVADVSYTRGFQGKFGGMMAYESSNLYSTAVFQLATNPTANDSFVLGGVKFTFVSSIGTTAGNILIGASAAATVANVVSAVNGTAGAGTTYIELDRDDRVRLSGVSATNGTTFVTFTGKGGALGASSSMTAAANDFDAQVTYCAIMEKGAIKMAIRNSVRVEPRDVSNNLVTNWHIYARYGVSCPTRAKERIVVIPVVSASAEA